MIYKIYGMQMIEPDGNRVHPVNPVELSWMGSGLRLPRRREGIMVRTGGEHMTNEALSSGIMPAMSPRHAMASYAAFLAVTVMLIGMALDARADELLYAYEGDILPYEGDDPWLGEGTCDQTCTDFIEDGHYVMSWPMNGDGAGYAYIMPVDPTTLWVEWQYKSNLPFMGSGPDCDGWFTVRWAAIIDTVFFLGDFAFSFSLDGQIGPFELNEWHTFRFESLDGINYSFAVDGTVFWEHFDFANITPGYLTLCQNGGCGDNWVPDMKAEWDFIRYGEITFGERIVVEDPPGGVLSPVEHGSLTQFAVTYDSPNYVYVDEISVTTTAPLPDGELPPQVTRTHRYDNGSPDTVVITLDKPIPLNGETTFTFFDGTITGEVSYSYQPGDADGDGDVDLADYAAFATCFAPGPACSEPEGICTLFDVAGNPDFPRVGLPDFAAFADIITGPNE